MNLFIGSSIKEISPGVLPGLRTKIDMSIFQNNNK
jgi:hypothetical protein